MTTQTANKPAPRVFRTGTTVITEDDSTRGLDIEVVRSILKRTYPEPANASFTEETDYEGRTVVTFRPKPRRKG